MLETENNFGSSGLIFLEETWGRGEGVAGRPGAWKGPGSLREPGLGVP